MPANPSAPANKPVLQDYTVNHAAVVLRTAKDAATRFLRGAKLRLNPENAETKLLLEAKALVEGHDGVSGKAPSARAVFKSLGAADDPVAAPVSDVIPVPASNEEVEAAK